MGPFSRLLTAGLFLIGMGGIALAQEQAPQDPPATTTHGITDADEKPAPVAFAGGTFTIARGDGEEPEERMVLAYEGKEIAHDFFISFNRIARVADIDVALFDLDSGGTGCIPKALIIWKPEGSTTLQSKRAEQDYCGTLSMAVADDAIYFMPYVPPAGDPKSILLWTPQDGLSTAGRLSFATEPNTGWNDIELPNGQNIVDAFSNEAVYKAAEKLLGDHLGNVAKSLLAGAGVKKTRSGASYGSGCVPHLCDIEGRGFMAVDVKNRALYFALRTSDKPEPKTWPVLKNWPDELKEELAWAYK